MSTQKRFSFLFAVAMFGGNATYFRNLQDAVAKIDDVDATWLPVEIELPELIAKVPPFSLNWTLRGALVTKLRISRLERMGKRFDAALFHHQVLTLMLGKFVRRVPHVISTDVTPRQHDAYGHWYGKTQPPFAPLLRSVKIAATRNAYARAQYLLPFSDWTRQSLIDDYGADATRVITIPPGVDLGYWKRPQKKQTGDGPVNILFVGGEFLRKGGDILADIARSDEFSGCVFHFVTQSYSGAAAPNIRVHTNLSANSDALRRLYEEADIFILPTRADFSPWAIVEAMSQRTPVIATDSGGISEMITDGHNGFLVDIGDRAAIEARIRTLMRSPELRERLGDAGRRMVEERYDRDANVCRLVTYMKTIANTNHAAH